jgi:hypothetical protein
MDHLQEGLSLVTQAVLQDKDGNVKEAIDLYEKSIVHLEKAAISTFAQYEIL